MPRIAPRPPPPQRPGRNPLAGQLLRLIILAMLVTLGVLLTYTIWGTSPYNPAAFSRLRDATLAYGVLCAIYAWKVKTWSRWLPLATMAIAGAAFVEYLWRIRF